MRLVKGAGKSYHIAEKSVASVTGDAAVQGKNGMPAYSHFVFRYYGLRGRSQILLATILGSIPLDTVLFGLA